MSLTDGPTAPLGPDRKTLVSRSLWLHESRYVVGTADLEASRSQDSIQSTASPTHSQRCGRHALIDARCLRTGFSLRLDDTATQEMNSLVLGTERECECSQAWYVP